MPTDIYWDPDTSDLARGSYVADHGTDSRYPDAFVGGCTRSWSSRSAAPNRSGRSWRIRSGPVVAGGQGRDRMYPLRSSTQLLVRKVIVADRAQLDRDLPASPP